MEIICINSKFSDDVLKFYSDFGVKIPTENKIYTIRDKRFHSNGKFGVLLEEIVNPLVPIYFDLIPNGKIEPTFDAKRFTDLLGNNLLKYDEDDIQLVREEFATHKVNEFYKNV